jgi:hypothetical protein
LAVDFSTVPDIKDSNLLATVVNPVKNTVVCDSNPPSFLQFPSEEFGSGGREVSDNEKIAASIF